MSDVTVIDGGSVALLQPNTPEATQWIEDNIGQDNGFQPNWPTVLCERQYVLDILYGMQEYGLSLEMNGLTLTLQPA